MEIQIIETTETPLQVLIRCQKADSRIQRLRAHIALFDSRLQARDGEETCFVDACDVLYFESVDNRTFLYTADAVLEIRQRLYELELLLSERDFLRISKSQIVNLRKISALRPELNRTILATMCNGEKLSVSRKYVPALRRLLQI